MIIDLTKKIAEMKKTEKAQHIETILSFKDFENMEVADLRTIASVIEAYQKEKAILDKAELIKEKYSLYSKIYFNDSDDEIETLLNAMEVDDEARFIYHLQNEFDVILKSKTPKERLETIEEIKELFKEAFTLTDENFQPAMTRVHITDNWEKALRGMQAEKIAKDLNYSFLDGELTELFLLHKTTDKRVIKKRIEDLLTYCNFHYESGVLHNGYYELLL
jgi:hypothetical protein